MVPGAVIRVASWELSASLPCGFVNGRDDGQVYHHKQFLALISVPNACHSSLL